MRYSKSFLPTMREMPSAAETIAHQLMLRAGLIRKVAAGIYEWLPAGLRVLKKVEGIVRDEMNAIDGQEVWLPILQPRELWEETGRWPVYGKELMRIKDRKDNDFCLGPTAEEVVTDLVRREVRSYRALPVMLYQFGTKFRDEIRPRFGVMRAREFYMKDAYSFHVDEEDSEKYYKRAFEAYTRIFERCGLKFRPVEADSGAIGGSYSHEFMVLADTGEEGIVSCTCGYGANVERAETAQVPLASADGVLPMQEVSTPGATSVEAVAKLLSTKSSQLIKSVILVADDQPVVVLLRGDHELNELKLQRYLQSKWIKKADETVYRDISGSPVGFAGPTTIKGRMIADFAVAGMVDAVAGGSKADTHLQHVQPGRDFKPEAYIDLRKAAAGDECPRCGKPLQFSRGIEVGHTFKLGTKYSVSMKANYLDSKGASIPMVMGCYGIGVSRIVAACIEQCHDESGIIWPESLAPWDVSIVPLNVTHDGLKELAEKIYRQCNELGLHPLLDDRDERAGVKLKDADLLGLPVRITLGERKLAENKVEIKNRSEKTAQDIPVDDLSNWLSSWAKNRKKAPASVC